MTTASSTLIPVTTEDAHEQTSAMAAVALFIVALFSCAVGSGFGFVVSTLAARGGR